MHKSNNYVSFAKAKYLMESEGFRFAQEMAQKPKWYKISNGSTNYWLNEKTARQIKSEIINKKHN